MATNTRRPRGLDNLDIPLDLEEAIARLRKRPIERDPYLAMMRGLRLPEEQAPVAPPPPPPSQPFPRNIIPDMFERAYGKVTGGAAAGSAAAGAGPEPPSDLEKYEREHEDINRQIDVGANFARERGGENAAEEYLYQQHSLNFGRRVADLLKSGREHTRRRMSEGRPAEEAATEGQELALRHLKNLKRAQEAGELSRDADETGSAYEGLLQSLTTPRGIARTALTTGVPMVVTGAVSAVASPIIGGGAGVAARTVMEGLAQRFIDKREVDLVEAATAGVTELIDVPGIAALRTIGRAVPNPLIRTALQTIGGAIAEGAQEGTQAIVENLVREGVPPNIANIAAQATAGALIGGALGPLLGGAGRPGRPGVPVAPVGAPGEAPGAPGPGVPPVSADPSVVAYLQDLGYAVDESLDSWLNALDRAVRSGDRAGTAVIERIVAPYVQGPEGPARDLGTVGPRVDRAVQDAINTLEADFNRAMAQGNLGLAQDIAEQIQQIRNTGQVGPAPPPATGREMGPVPGAAPRPAPAAPEGPREMGPIEVRPRTPAETAPTVEGEVTARAPQETQDLLDRAEGGTAGVLPGEAGIGMIQGDARGTGAGGPTVPVVPPPPGQAGTTQVFAPPPAMPPPVTEEPTPPPTPPVQAPPPSPPPPGPTLTVPEILRRLMSGAASEGEATALLRVAGRIQAALGNNPPVEALDRLRMDPAQPLTPEEDDALTAFQLALAGGLPGPEPTVEEVEAGMAPPPARPAEPPPTAPAEAAPPAEAPPTEAPPAPVAEIPQAPTEPTPEKRDRRNSVWVGRGAHGKVRVVFPDENHKILYNLGAKTTYKTDYDARLRTIQGLAGRWGISDKELGRLITQYRDQVAQGIKDLAPETEWNAPSVIGGTGEVAWEPPTEGPPEQPTPEAAVHGATRRGEKGEKKWVYEERDAAGTLVSSWQYDSKREAEDQRKYRARALQQNRRELKKTELNPVEAKTASTAPLSFPTDMNGEHQIPHANGTFSLEIQKEFHNAWLRGEIEKTAPLYRLLARVKRLGGIVHPEWNEHFPGLEQITETGRDEGALPRPAEAAEPAPPPEPLVSVTGAPIPPRPVRTVEQERISEVRGVGVIFKSGMTRRADALAALDWEVPFGIDINELSEPLMREIGRAIGHGLGPKIFVDSGAFSAFKRGATQDISEVIAKYRRLLEVITEENPNEEEADLFLTLPDVIANQDATLESYRTFADEMGKLLGRFTVIVPLQAGAVNLAQFRSDVLDVLPRSLKDRPISWGIPSNAAAAPLDQIAGLGKSLRLEDSKEGVHFLGAGSENRLRPLVDALGEIQGLVSADSNRLRSLINRAGSREAGLAEMLKTEGAPPAGRPRPPVEPIDEDQIQAEDGPGVPSPEVEAPAPEAEETMLGTRAVEAWARWLKARGIATDSDVAKNLRRMIERHRGIIRDLRIATNGRHDWLQAKPSVGLSGADIRRKRQETLAALKNAEANYEASVKQMRAAIESIPGAPWRSFFQIADARLPVPREKVQIGELLPRTTAYIQALHDAPENLPINFETLEARVIEYKKTAVVSDDAVLRGLEQRAASAMTRAANGQKVDWKREFAAFLEGVGAKAVEDALRSGPSHKAWQKIVDYQKRELSEDRAMWEALSEDGMTAGWSGTQESVGVITAAMRQEVDALPADEDPELPWGLVDPATGAPVRARAAVGALEAKTGRLYARILQALEDSLVGEVNPEVPFDIPEGNPDDIPPFEAGEDIEEAQAILAAKGKTLGNDPAERLMKLMGFRSEEEPPRPKPSILNMPLGKPLIRAAQDVLDTGPRKPYTPPREPGVAAGQAARPGAGGRGDVPGGRTAVPPVGAGAGLPVRPGRPVGREPGAPGGEGDVVARPVPGGEGLFRIVTIRPNYTVERPINRAVVPARLVQHLDEHQVLGASRAIEAMSEDERGFLLADGTGVGKTREILTVAEYFSKLGHPVIIFAPASVLNIPKSGEQKGQITGSYADDSRTMGVQLNHIRLAKKIAKGPELQKGKIYLTQYEFIEKQQVTPDTVVIFDEAHYIKNPPGQSDRGDWGQKFARTAHAAMFATATPGDQAHHLMYAQRIGLLEGRDEAQFLTDMGMVRATVYNKQTQSMHTIWKARNNLVMRRAIKELYGRLTKAGKMIRREVDFSPVEVEFRTIPVSAERLEELAKIETAWPGTTALERRMVLMHQRRQLEPDKIQTVLDIMDSELEAGRSVVIFTQRLRLSKVIKRTKVRGPGGEMMTIEDFITETEGTLKTIRAALEERRIPYAEIHGEVSGPKDTQIQKFQSGQARVILATVEGGGTGINLDDRVGTRPRTLIMMTAPLESTVYIQAMGRVHRKPTKSRSRVIGLFSEHPIDDWNKDIIAKKLQLQGAQVAGSVGKLDPTIDELVDIDFGEDIEELRPGGKKKPTDDGQTKPGARVDLAVALSTLKNLVTFNGQYRNPKRLYKQSAYNIHRKAVEALGGVIDIGGKWHVETKDGWIIRGRLTHPNERQGTYGTFEFDQGSKQGEASGFGAPSDDPDVDLVRGVDELIRLLPQYSDWRNFHREHRDTLAQIFGPDATLFARLLGATSQRARVEVNISLALRAYQQLRLGQPFIGFQQQVARNLERIRSDAALGGSKIAPYTRALLGDEEAVWVDRHIGRLVLGREGMGGEDQSKLTQTKERIVAALLRQAAKELGWTPAQASSASWAAGQVLEGGVKKEDIRDYARSLQARASAIRRFYDYFGPVALSGGRALSSVADSAARPRNLGFGSPAGGPEPEHAASPETQVEALVSIEKALRTLPTPHVAAIGTGFGKPGEDYEVWWSALAANFNDRAPGGSTWTIRWEDYRHIRVNTPEQIAAIAQIARNPALEQASVILVKHGEMVGSLLSGSGVPGFTRALPEGWTNDDLRVLVERTGADGYYLVHNHPDGSSRPSSSDIVKTVEIAGDVPGFRGHVIVDHGTFRIITKAHVDTIVAADKKGKRTDAIEKIHTDLRASKARSVGLHRAPDPLLAPGIDAREYWYSQKYVIRGVDPMVEKFGSLLQGLSRQSNKPKWPIVVLSSNGWKLRAVLAVDPKVYYDRAAFTKWLEDRKHDFGAFHAFVAIEETVGGTDVAGIGHPYGWSSLEARATFDQTTTDYVQTNLVQGAVDPSAAARAQTGRNIENWLSIYHDLSGFHVEEDDPPPGAPPPRRPRPNGDDPNDPEWRRRVDFAEARAAAGGRWTVERLRDALLVGVDRFLRGLRDFARWALSMNFLGLGPYLRAIWARIGEMFAPRAYTEEGRPRSLAEGDIADMVPSVTGRRVIRPIPRARPVDVEAAAARIAEGRREIPRIAPPRHEGGQPGERPPAQPINMDRFSDQDDIKNLMRQIMEALRPRFRVVRGYRSWAEVEALAVEAGLTEQDVARLLREKGVLTDLEIEAIRVLRQEAMIDTAQKLAYVQDVTSRLATTTEARERAILEDELLEAERNYRAALHRGIGIMFTTVAAGAEAGRALAIHRRFIESLTPGERFMRRMLRGVPEDTRWAAELAEAIQANDLRTVMRLYHRMHRPGFWGYFNEYFINSILSGPSTLLANIAGNVTHEAMRTVERGVSGGIEQLGIRAVLERFFGVAEPTGPERSVREMREAARTLLKYRMALPAMWREFRLALTQENIPIYSQGEWAPPVWPGRLGTIIRTPGRLMKALDVASKYAAAAAERSVQVYRMAMAEVESGAIQPSQLNERVLAIDEELQTWMQYDRMRQVNPRDPEIDYNFLTRNRKYAGVVKAMNAAAAASTFQDDVLPLTRMLMTARARHPWLTPIVPFIKTPERILVAAMKRTPLGLVQALNAMRTGQLRGGEASDRLAQGFLGTMTAIVVYSAVKEGLLTGGGPGDPKERQTWLQTGRLPYAIRIGGTWVSLARLEPIATMLGFAADLAEAQDAQTAGDAWDKLHYSILNNITNKTYLEGMINVTEAISDPDRYGAQFSKRMVGALVPNLLASAARAVDPTIRQTDDISSTLMARVPILSEQLPPKLTGTGEPRLRKENVISRFISPIRYSEEGGPERNLERIFLETGYSPSAPPRAVRLPGTGGREYMLTPEERAIYAEYAGRATTFARGLAQNYDWSRLDVYQKEEVLKRIYRFAHDAARRDIYRSMYARLWAGQAEEKRKR